MAGAYLDPYYIPPHLSAPFTKGEIAAYIEIFKLGDAADGDADGYIESECVRDLFSAVGENATDAKVEALLNECDPAETGNLGFLDILRVMSRSSLTRPPRKVFWGHTRPRRKEPPQTICQL